MSAELSASLKSVDWEGNVSSFLSEEAVCGAVHASMKRLAIWSKQLENVDKGNPAISFVRSMQVSGHQSIATMSLAIYKASASSIRGIFENALYYTYFRDHPVELASLVREKSYYASKADIISFHKLHTPGFKSLQEKVGLISRVEDWYSRISAVIHGQIPGTWVDQTSMADIRSNTDTLNLASKDFCEAEWIVHHLFLATLGRAFWDGFTHTAKKALLAGMSGEMKSTFALDKA